MTAGTKTKWQITFSTKYTNLPRLDRVDLGAVEVEATELAVASALLRQRWPIS